MTRQVLRLQLEAVIREYPDRVALAAPPLEDASARE